MRIAARILFTFVFLFAAFVFFKMPVHAQTIDQNTIVAHTSNSPSLIQTGNIDSTVPINHDTYTQIVLIDVMSAIMCQLTGIDPINPKQACLGVDPSTGKIGFNPSSTTQQFGQAANSKPQIGGALGVMTQYISFLYIPAVSSTQYVSYLSDNFGIVKHAYAAGGNTCANSPLGYGFCGLEPIFKLWTYARNFAYALLTILFMVIGVGVMLRFRVDPRTVMTLQNQIPRVIIAILLITFSYAIAGVMVDLMWTVTYAGINFISSASNAQVAVGCPKPIKPLSQAAEQTLIDQPVSFTDMIFNSDCNGIIHSGLFKVSDRVSKAFGDLVVQVISDLLGLNIAGGCDLNPFNFDLSGCAAHFFLWLTEQIIKLIIIIAILIALFRLWFELLKTYLTFLIFVIMGPVWIVFGLIPGRPLGFEKWLRIIFANLAAFPLVAFILVFGRVLIDAVPHAVSPQNVFIPPLVGNPNVATFSDFLGFGAIMIAPTIPQMIKDRMKATGQAKFGSTVAAGIGFAAGAATSPAKRVWEGLNRRNPTTGQAEGSLAIMKQRAWQKTPFVGRRAIAKRSALQKVAGSGGVWAGYGKAKRESREQMKIPTQDLRATRQSRPTTPPSGNQGQGGQGNQGNQGGGQNGGNQGTT